MPGDVSLSDSECKFLQSDLPRINLDVHDVSDWLGKMDYIMAGKHAAHV